MIENDIRKKVYDSLKETDRICKNCKFNFDGICAAHDSHWGYGQPIKYDFESCYEWQISFDYFLELAEK